MLKHLSISGFTLIAQAEVPFREGFTAITGETGAGKSVLLKALRIVCGDKAQASMVRTGEEKAVVEATFDISNEPQVKSVLEELELDSDDELIIRREIQENGKSRARVNGAIVALPDLQRLGEELIQMHGQSEQLLLRDTRTHTKMLDDFAGNSELLATYSAEWTEWNKIQEQIKATEERAKNLAAQKDFLKFQFDELSKAALKEGEEEALEEKVNSASKQEAETRYLNEIQGMLGGENGLLDQVQILTSKLRTLATKLPDYEDYLKSLEEVTDPYESVCKDLLRLRPTAAMSAADIDRANARIAQIQKLQSKKALEALQATALKLTTSRQEAAARYDMAVSDILHTLGMPKAIFTTAITMQSLSPNGADKIEFTLAPNPGEGFKSLQKAVSGGELSRVLLSIKSVMADLDRVPLLIFDEVDSGISGEVGNSIGIALKNLGKHHQVLTITHLHQVASRAVNQLAVSKEEIDGRTYTHVKELDHEGRVDELSRMLGGESDTVREHARQLLEA